MGFGADGFAKFEATSTDGSITGTWWLAVAELIGIIAHILKNELVIYIVV